MLRLTVAELQTPRGAGMSGGSGGHKDEYGTAWGCGAHADVRGGRCCTADAAAAAAVAAPSSPATGLRWWMNAAMQVYFVDTRCTTVLGPVGTKAVPFFGGVSAVCWASL